MGGLYFLFRCNYNVRHWQITSSITKNYLSLHGYDQSKNIVLFNNKDVSAKGKPAYLYGWFKRGVVFINNLLNENKKFLTLKEFSDKFGCQINFLHYQQVISAITTRLLTNAKDNATPNQYSSQAVKKYLNSKIMWKFIWIKLDQEIFANYWKTKPTWAIILVLLSGARVSHYMSVPGQISSSH